MPVTVRVVAECCEKTLSLRGTEVGPEFWQVGVSIACTIKSHAASQSASQPASEQASHQASKAHSRILGHHNMMILSDLCMDIMVAHQMASMHVVLN
jgi:hypothetical protein